MGVAAMIMIMVMMLLIVVLMMWMPVVLTMLIMLTMLTMLTMDPKLGGRDPRPQHPFGRHDVRSDRKAPERGAQAVEREAQIDQRAQDHVARRTGETIEVGNPGQR
jgi:hypothetical protein